MFRLLQSFDGKRNIDSVAQTFLNVPNLSFSAGFASFEVAILRPARS
jgi:hypothetical protein